MNELIFVYSLIRCWFYCDIIIIAHAISLVFTIILLTIIVQCGGKSILMSFFSLKGFEIWIFETMATYVNARV